jgi:hypothetical protein
MHIAIPLVARFKEYHEREVSERVTVDRYIKKLEKEEFFTSNNVLVCYDEIRLARPEKRLP